MWNSYNTPPNPANASNVNDIYENQLYIADKISVNIKEISATTSMLYKDIAQMYIDIEENFDAINDTDFQSIYYLGKIIRGDYEPNRIEWQRWIDILNDIKSIADGEKNKWCKLLCKDGYPTIKSQNIIVRGNE